MFRSRFFLNCVLNHNECLLTLKNKVALIELTRPSRKNALGRVLLSELAASIDYCASAADVRAVVLCSSLPDVFCAGADLKERKEMSPDEARAFVDQLRSTFCAFEDLKMPTIAAIEGAALGGGLEIALAADIRIAGERAKLGVPETSLAIIPGAGGSQRLARVVGLSHAKQLAFTSSAVTAERAAQIALVNECVPAGSAKERALALADKIAANGPIAVRSVKAAMIEGQGLPRDEAMAVERRYYETVLGTEDRLEGLRAFQEKRPPQYQGK